MFAQVLQVHLGVSN